MPTGRSNLPVLDRNALKANPNGPEAVLPDHGLRPTIPIEMRSNKPSKLPRPTPMAKAPVAVAAHADLVESDDDGGTATSTAKAQVAAHSDLVESDDDGGSARTYTIEEDVPPHPTESLEDVLEPPCPSSSSEDLPISLAAALGGTDQQPSVTEWLGQACSAEQVLEEEGLADECIPEFVRSSMENLITTTASTDTNDNLNCSVVQELQKEHATATTDTNDNLANCSLVKELQQEHHVPFGGQEQDTESQEVLEEEGLADECVPAFVQPSAENLITTTVSTDTNDDLNCSVVPELQKEHATDTTDTNDNLLNCSVVQELQQEHHVAYGDQEQVTDNQEKSSIRSTHSFYKFEYSCPDEDDPKPKQELHEQPTRYISSEDLLHGVSMAGIAREIEQLYRFYKHSIQSAQNLMPEPESEDDEGLAEDGVPTRCSIEDLITTTASTDTSDLNCSVVPEPQQKHHGYSLLFWLLPILVVTGAAFALGMGPEELYNFLKRLIRGPSSRFDCEYYVQPPSRGWLDGHYNSECVALVIKGAYTFTAEYVSDAFNGFIHWLGY